MAPRARRCTSCRAANSSSLMLAPPNPTLTFRHVWRSGGVDAIAAHYQVERAEAARRIFTAGLFGRRAMITVQQAVWLTDHLNMSTREAAAHLGVTAMTVSRWRHTLQGQR